MQNKEQDGLAKLRRREWSYVGWVSPHSVIRRTALGLIRAGADASIGGMKFPVSLTFAALFALALPSAQAQIRIGDVTLTKPAQPAPVQQPSIPARPASSTRSGAAMTPMTVPAGSYQVQGRISAAQGTVSLPAGSSVSVSVNDLTRPAQVVQIQFKTSRLSTPYQLFFNSGRINPAHRYAVQATVTDASGKVLYRSDSSALLPGGKNAVVNVTVR